MSSMLRTAASFGGSHYKNSGKLHETIKVENVAEVKKLLRSENPNGKDEFQQTPLHIACTVGNLDIVDLLLSRKAELNSQDRNGWTPLHCCACYGHLQISLVLLHSDNIDAGILTKDGTSVLHYFARMNLPQDQLPTLRKVIITCIQKRCDINAQTKHGESALHQACQRGNVNCVRLLLENGAQINLANRVGESCLHYAVLTRNKELIQLLLDKGADPLLKSQKETPLDLSKQFPEIYELFKQYDKNASKNEEDVQVFDITQLKLKVKIMQGSNLSAVGDNESANPACYLEFGNQKKNTKPVKDSLSPKWGDVFYFNIEDSQESLKVNVYDVGDDDAPTKEDLIGSTVLSLSELDLDASGSGNPTRSWHQLKRKTTKKDNKGNPKIRLEFSLVKPEDVVDDTKKAGSIPSDEDEMSDKSASSGGETFGYKRGKCKNEDCDCEHYQPESSRGGPCRNCGHYPASHENLTKDSNNREPPTDLAASGLVPFAPAPEEAAQAAPKETVSELSERFAAMKGKLSTGSSWEIDAGELVFSKLLGEGTSATVYRGVYRGQEVAIKVLKETAEEKVLEEFTKEFEIMSSLRSPHVVFFYGACLKPSMSMVLEFCHKGSLCDVLQNCDENISWSRVFKICLDMVKGINCLHSWKPQILHRDLKTLNFLVDENWTVKVGDFGLSRFNAESSTATLGKLRGTYAYCAPEVYFGKQYTTKADIFSMGIILWEIVYRCITGKYQQPYSEYPQLVFDFQIIVQTAKKNLRPTFPKGTPQSFIEAIERCWCPEPEKRPEANELQQILLSLQKEYQQNKKLWNNAIQS